MPKTNKLLDILEKQIESLPSDIIFFIAISVTSIFFGVLSWLLIAAVTVLI